MAVAGAVWVDVLPDMSKFGAAMRSGVQSGSTAAGVQSGKSFGQSFDRAAGGNLKAANAKMTRQIAQGGDKAGRQFGAKFSGAAGGSFKTLAAGAGAAFAAVGVAGFFKDAVTGASDLAETTSKIQQIFGDSAGAVQAFAASASTSLGQTKQQALDANATFGIFGKSAGLAGADLTNFTGSLTTLATDLASFNNTTPEAAINAIGSALRGEAEPMRQFGVLLDDASMRQQALKMGLISTTKDALTPQQKVLSAQALILEQTKTAQGDFARTSGGLANQQRILAAKFTEAKTALGSAFLPALTSAANFITGSVIPGFRSLGDWVSRNRETLIATGGVIATAAAMWAAYTITVRAQTAALALYAMWQARATIATTIATGATAAWNAVLALNPIGLVVAALVGLGVALVVAYKRSETFRNIVNAAWAGIKAAVSAAWENVIKPVFGQFMGLLRSAGSVVSWLWRNVAAPAFAGIRTVISVWFNSFARPILGMFMALLRTVGGVVSWLWRTSVQPAFQAIGRVISFVWANTIRPTFDRLRTALTVVSTAFSLAKDAIGRAWDQVREKAAAPIRFVVDTVFNRGILPVWNSVIDKFGGDKLNPIQGFAKGGRAPRGWAMVGEQGPELVNFTNPGRVYTAEQTAAAFGAMGGPGDWARSAASVVGRGAGWVRDRAEELGEVTLGGLRAAAEHLLQPVRGLINAIPGGGTPYGDMARNIPSNIIDRMLGFLGAKDSEVPAGFGSAPAVGRNGWVFPLPRGSYSVGAGYPNYPSGGYHGGWDFPAQQGTPVYAPYPGFVSVRDLGNSSYGKYVNLVAGGMRFIGAHLSAFGKTGMVSAGDLIGRVGSTGNSTGSHLHAEFRENGQRINPRHLLSFDSGGWLPPGMNLTYNGTGGPEPVLTRQQWADVRGGANGTHLQVYLGTREITDIVRVVVDGRDQAMTNSLAYGQV